MSNPEKNNIPLRRKKRRRKKNYGYLYLFAFVFLIALAGLSYIVKSYSPDIDVAIGNNEALTLGESEMDVEIKSVDERLKWIQMEDEMPSVALRNNGDKDSEHITKKEVEKKENEQVKKINKPPVPSITDIQNQRPDFRSITPATPVIPQAQPIQTVTKVYLGTFSSLEEAMSIQNKVADDEPTVAPFIKAVKDSYIVQLGSFSDKDKANALVVKLRAKGYYPKITSQN